MLKKEGKKVNMAIFAVLALTAVFVSALVFEQSGAWLSHKDQRDFDLQYSNYSVKANLFFGGVAAPTDSDNLFIIDVVDPEAENYIAKMKINISYQGKSMAYLRVKLIDEWTYEDPQFGNREVLSNTAVLNYNIIGDNWVDNRKNDGYYYYKLPVGNKVVEASDQLIIDETPVILNMIDVMKPGVYVPDSEYKALALQMRMGVKVEAVQVNRIKAFWGERAAGWVTPYVAPK